MPKPFTTIVVFVVGPTCAGKSTFLGLAKEALGDRAHLIEIGKAMRAKYPPQHFQGDGAPAHTQAEAMQMLQDGLAVGLADEKVGIVFVDGQPRCADQLAFAAAGGEGWMPVFLHLTAEHGVLFKRGIARSGEDVDAMDLVRSRIVKDRLALYDLLPGMFASGAPFLSVDTANGIDLDFAKQILDAIRVQAEVAVAMARAAMQAQASAMARVEAADMVKEASSGMAAAATA